MSVDHAIDLSNGSQGVFSSSLSEVIKTATYWTIYDQKNHSLLSNVDFDIKACTHNPKNQPRHCLIPFLTMIFIENQNHSVVSPYYLFKSSIIYLNKECLLYSYYKILSADFYHFLFNNDEFNKKDNLGNELSFDVLVKRLKDSNPLMILTKKEWTVSWLLISGFSTIDISEILQIKLNTVRKYIERILGIKKLGIFKRELFIQVALHLGWNLFIPSFFIKKNHCINSQTLTAY